MKFPVCQNRSGKVLPFTYADEYIMVSEIEEAIRLYIEMLGRTGAVNDLQRRYFPYRQTGNLCNYIKCNTGLFHFFCILEAFFLTILLKTFFNWVDITLYQSRKFFKLSQYSPNSLGLNLAISQPRKFLVHCRAEKQLEPKSA